MADTSIAATLGTGTLLLAASVNGGVATPIGIVAYEGNDGTPHDVTPATPMPVTDAASEASLASLVTASGLQATSALQGTANTALAAIQTSTAAIAAATPVLVGGAVPVTAAALPLPTGAATSALQTTGNTYLAGIEMACNSLATGVVIQSSALPAGAATSALQTTGNTSLSTIATHTPALGAATTANSSPVNIASDQTVPVSAAALPLPTGAATAANQATANTSLAAIQTSTAASATAANQTTANTALAAIQTSTAASATAANQATANTSLATIATNTTPATAGQLPSASSRSVVTASDDPNLGPCTLTGCSAISAANQTLWSVNVQGMAMAYCHIPAIGTSNVVTFECSNDDTNWNGVEAVSLGNPGVAAASTTANSSGMYAVTLGFGYFRVRVGSYTTPIAANAGYLALSPKPVSTPISTALTITPIPVTSQGSSHASKFISTTYTSGSAISSQVATSAVNLAALIISNSNATTGFFVKIYNVASGLSVGTTVPVWVIYVPPKTTLPIDCGPFSNRLFTGFALSINSGFADTDNASTGLNAGDVIVSWLY